MNIAENELIMLCKRKNAKAQKLLYNNYHSILLGICLRYGKSRAEAEDTLQQGMITIFKKINSYTGKGSFEGWLKKIMVNTAIDNFRKNNKFYNHQNIDELNGKSYFNSNTSNNMEVQDLMSTIQQLPPGYRMVFNLFAIEGYSHKEIAKKLDISENTSKTQLLKARKNLKEKLELLDKLPSQIYNNERR